MPDVAGQDVAPEQFKSALSLPALNVGVEADPNGLPVVVLLVATQFGQQAYPLDAGFAGRVGELMAAEAAKASAGFVTPAPSRLIVPGRS